MRIATVPLFDAVESRFVRETLAEAFSSLPGHSGGIVQVSAETFAGSSSFATGRLLVEFGDGSHLSIFAKDLNPDFQLAEARATRAPGLARSRREVWMYEQVLPALELGTPRHYATRWDVEHGRYWLFLEDVGPKRLSRLGERSLWLQSADWLARFHAATRFAVSPRGELAEFDVSRFHDVGDRLEPVMTRLPEEDRLRLERAAHLTDDLLTYLSSTATGMFHGEFFGKNIVVRRGAAEESIAVIDWETAGFGPQLIDLASICAGRWNDSQRVEMRRAYLERLAKESEDAPGWAEFTATMDAVAVLNALAWLSWWADGDDEHVLRWMREVRMTLDVWERPDATRAGGARSTKRRGRLRA